MTATQIAQQILDEQGFLITSSSRGRGVTVGRLEGPVESDWFEGAVPGPFYCIGEATIDEYIAQYRRYNPSVDLEKVRAKALRDGWELRKLVAE